MKTAPRDGFPILAYDPVMGVTAAYFGWEDIPYSPPEAGDDGEGMENLGPLGWWGYDPFGTTMIKPTYWMPMPDEPDVSRETQEWD